MIKRIPFSVMMSEREGKNIPLLGSGLSCSCKRNLRPCLLAILCLFLNTNFLAPFLAFSNSLLLLLLLYTKKCERKIFMPFLGPPSLFIIYTASIFLFLTYCCPFWGYVEATVLRPHSIHGIKRPLYTLKDSIKKYMY